LNAEEQEEAVDVTGKVFVRLDRAACQDLDDSKDLSFALIQDACARQFRRYPDNRRSTRDIDERHRGDDRRHDRRQATPRREHKDIPRHKDFTRSSPGDVCVFLSNIHGIKPTGVLRNAGFSPDESHDTFAIQALYEAAQPYMPATVTSDAEDSDAPPAFEGSDSDAE
jgi:hypothetical protein